MKHIGEKQLSVLLCVGFLSQIFVGSSQPYGVNAAVLLPVALLGTLFTAAAGLFRFSSVLYHWL